MSDDFYALIMAGGGGTRLWPLSRRARPKQLLHLVGDRSLFQMTVDRLQPLIPVERIHIVTIEEQADALHEQVAGIPKENFLAEPCPRGTASVIGLGAIMLQERYGDCVMACLPADHYMENDEHFRNCLNAAYELAKQGHLVTLGITPTHPATGYGYIHWKEHLKEVGGLTAYSVESFKEKPSVSEAESYIEHGEYAWNSGMFIWKTSAILHELNSQMPDLYACLIKVRDSLNKPDQQTVLEKGWEELQSETIDYGVMEGAENVAMIVADELGWFDIGGWSGLVEILQKDRDGNLLLGEEILAIDTSKTLVYQENREEHKRLIALLGVDDLIVVESSNAILICPRARAEEVRRLVEKLEDENRSEYL